MKNIKLSLLLATVAALVVVPARASGMVDAQGIKDACAASVILGQNNISSEVVVAGGEAGCIYQAGGVSYLYTTKGSAKINPDQLGRVALQKVPRSEVAQIADGSRDIQNGCLVFATCAYAQDKHNSQVVWAGIIAAQVINVGSYGGDGERFGGNTGHAITVFENKNREIFIQEDGEEPRKVDKMSDLAQSGNHSWHDSSTLMYCDHRIQGLTTFKGEFGRPL